MSDRRLALMLLLLASPAPGTAAPEPLTVRGAVERALTRDPSLLAARRAAEEGAAALQIAQSPFHPQFVLTTTPGVTTGLPLSVAGEPPAAAGARLRLMLWDPSLRADEAGALGRAASLAADAEAARQETIRRTVAVCARLFAGDHRVEAARRRLAAREAIHSRMQARQREGRVTDLESERAALDAERARHRLRAAESDRDLAAEELRRQSGLPDGAVPALADDPLAALPEAAGSDAVSAALASDPALKALAGEAGAAARAANLEDRWFKPQIVAEARYLYVPSFYDYDKYYLKVDSNTGSAGVSVVLPLLNGGLDSARAAKARAKEGRLKEQLRAREEEVTRGARATAANADLAGRELGLAKRSVAVAEEGLRVACALDLEGRGDADGVPRAELELAEAEDELWRATETLVGARLGLLAARGELAALGPVEAR